MTKVKVVKRNLLKFAKTSFEKTLKQIQAVKIIASCTFTLLEGGGRSGKTFIILYCIIIRCLLYPKSMHLVARFRFAHVKQAICYGTMPKVLRMCGLEKEVKLNKSNWFYSFSNGSSIWIGGLDDKERLEKILGNEYATIFLNEASQISYDAFEIILTRLNPPSGVKGKVIIDYNPPSMQHWGYKIFHLRSFPDGRPVPDSDFKKIKMNPMDNPHISDEYVRNLDLLTEAKRKRFKDGEYGMDEGSLWRRSFITYARAVIEEMIRVVVGVDPSGSEDGDEIGIVASAQVGPENYLVLDDASLHGTPKVWADEVNALYTKWNADLVVAEKNFGGDMVESTIKNSNRNINVKLVHSSRGKILRAEPISALYEQGKVKHRTLFSELEDEFCSYKPGMSKSPNRMDAAVFGLTELSSGDFSMLDAC